jgi:hypothetical protein
VISMDEESRHPPFMALSEGVSRIYGARATAGRGFAPIDASRGDDERVFDSLHGAGIDIKLVGNPTNGFSSL